MELIQRKPHRLKNFDYSQNGTYFITICVQDRKPILSRVIVGASIARPTKTELTDVGCAVEKAIQAISDHYHNVMVEKYVIMPNHIHLILVNHALVNSVNISEVIRQTKGYVTKQCGEKIWQKSFYDHIIRDEYDYQTKWNYIDENPARWLEDELYTESEP